MDGQPVHAGMRSASPGPGATAQSRGGPDARPQHPGARARHGVRTWRRVGGSPTLAEPPPDRFDPAGSPGARRWSSLTERASMTRIEVMSTQSLAAVKAHFSQVIDDVAGTHERVTVTRNGSPVAVILAVEDFDSLLETLEILSDRSAVADIREAEQQMAQGQTFSEEEVRAAVTSRRLR